MGLALKAKRGIVLLLAASLAAALLLSLNICPEAKAQDATAFSPADIFDIPDKNGSIRFAANGAYSKATLENGTWTFEDLTLCNPAGIQYFDLNISQSLKSLKISARDSDITVWAVATLNFSEVPMTMLGYSIEGQGEQTVKLGLNLTRPTDAAEWSIVDADEVFISAGKGWSLMPDDTLLIDYPTHNITIIHFNFIETVDSNTSFFLQHSVIILTATILTAVITITSIISYRQRKINKRTQTSTYNQK